MRDFKPDGLKLKMARLGKGMKQRELCEALGGVISELEISQYETGRATPPTAIAFKIAQILDVSAEDIFDRFKTTKT